MAFDKVDWHSGAENYPADLPPEAGGTHIGLFLAWIIMNDLYGEMHREDSSEAIEAVKSRRMTGREFLQQACDEKFWDEDLNAVGNAFARWYYGGDTNQGDPPDYRGFYDADYERVLASGLKSPYHVADTWENYDKIAPVITKRFEEWKRRQSRRWWQFWH